MWIVLLDHSSSMGERFAAAADGATFRDRRTEHSVKLDAAIESILIELGKLPPDLPVSLFGFTSSATLLHEGSAGSRAAFAAELNKLRPDNGTDIAAALEQARAHAGRLAPRPFVRILLVTDGRSDSGKATMAAQKCAQDGLAIDVVLIDATDESRQLATAIAGATGGRWDQVVGPAELKRATAEVAEFVAAQVQRTSAAQRQFDAEEAQIRARNDEREAVKFTASYPALLPPGSWHPLFVHVHRDGLRDQLETRLGELSGWLGPAASRADVPANSAIKRGTVLEVRPLIEKVRCRPSMVQIEWNEELEEAAFATSYAGDLGLGDTCAGSVLISAGAVLLAQVPVLLTIAEGPDAESPGFQSASAGMIRRVFGSYAHEDSGIVARLRAAYQALGIHLFVDTLDIDGGESWRRYLREQIADSDLFQLFWSAAAAASPEVENEWRYAIGVARELPRGTKFIRPVYWRKPVPAPPADLADLHFRYLDPQDFGATMEPGPSTSAGVAPAAMRCAYVRFPVIPLAPGPHDATAGHVQDALRTIVPFVENVTGLRYYPPVSYLVDDQTVITLRTAAEPDARRARDAADRDMAEQPRSLPAEQGGLVARLGQLLRKFHDHVDRRIASQPDFDHIKREAARSFTWNVRLYLTGGQPEVRGRPGDPLVRLSETSFPGYAHAYAERLLDFVRRDLTIPPERRRPSPEELSRLKRQMSVEKSAEEYARAVTDGVSSPRSSPIDRDYQREIERIFGRVLALIDARPEPAPEPALLRLALPTYGVFQYRGSRDGAGTDAVHVPDTAPAILISVNAFGRLADAVRADGQPDSHAQERAVALMVATLVHEHAHAAIATGLDQFGFATAAADTPQWTAGASLNEAIAAWVQRHYYRDDTVMYRECSEYIAAGDYPDWPYRGADTLERLYSASGIDVIQRFVHMLRANPEAAQREFDALVKASSDPACQ